MKFLALIGVGLLASSFISCGGSNAASPDATAGRAEKKAVLTLSKAERRSLPGITIAKRSVPPPRQLVVRDLREGTGAPVTLNDAVLVNYLSVRYVDAQRRARSGAFGTTRFGMSEVIKGWKVGLPGMKVGGRRELVVPPELHYLGWKQGSGRSRWTSIYVIDLLAVMPGAGS